MNRAGVNFSTHQWSIHRQETASCWYCQLKNIVETTFMNFSLFRQKLSYLFACCRWLSKGCPNRNDQKYSGSKLLCCFYLHWNMVDCLEHFQVCIGNYISLVLIVFIGDIWYYSHHCIVYTLVHDSYFTIWSSMTFKFIWNEHDLMELISYSFIYW